MSESKVILVGYSGHGLAVADSINTQNSHKLIGYIDQQPKEFNPFKLDYFGTDNSDVFLRIKNNKLKVILGVGDNVLRSKIFNQYNYEKISFINVIDKTSNLSKYITYGIGNFFSRNTIVNSFSTIENNCILNSGCIVEHECFLGSHVHIAPGAVLCGNVKIGEYSFIGANSSIKQGISIGKNVIVGAGSVVINNIPDYEIWVGNPAKKISNG